jgi:ABC-type hemin transport system ATPase subunit
VQARQKAADPFQRVAVVQLGRAPAAARADAEQEAAVRVQRASADDQRRHHRHLGGGQLGAKACSSSICASLQRCGR